MNFEFRHRPPELLPPSLGDAPLPTADDASAPSCESVLCRHGMHQGYFPIQGMTVGEARTMLAQLLNIDPNAVAVINGQIVDDEQVIGPEVGALNFMKESMVKG